MKAIFLDRDGVINKYPGDFNYVTSPEGFEFIPEVEIALKKLRDAGFVFFIISNQAGVAKGIYSQKTLDEITQKMLEGLKIHGIKIEAVLYCTHLPDANCQCRKPKTGLVEMAIKKNKSLGKNINLKSSYFIGDSIRDVETGKSSGLKTILVFSGREKESNANTWKVTPDLTAEDLKSAAELILKNE